MRLSLVDTSHLLDRSTQCLLHNLIERASLRALNVGKVSLLILHMLSNLVGEFESGGQTKGQLHEISPLSSEMAHLICSPSVYHENHFRLTTKRCQRTATTD